MKSRETGVEDPYPLLPSVLLEEYITVQLFVVRYVSSKQRLKGRTLLNGILLQLGMGITDT